MKKLMFVIGILMLFSCSEEMKRFDGKNSAGVKCKVGETFAITLTEDHAAGQTWSIQPVWDEQLIEYQKSIYNGKTEGKTDFIFIAKQTGSTQVKLNLIEYSDLKDSVVVQVNVSR